MVGFGLNAVDHLIVVPEYPAFDTKTRFTEYERSAGGQTASAMVALQRLGLKTAYAGRFGSDDDGRFGLLSLEYEGVNLDYAETIEGADNQVAFIIIDSAFRRAHNHLGSGRATFLSARRSADRTGDPRSGAASRCARSAGVRGDGQGRTATRARSLPRTSIMSMKVCRSCCR